MINDSANLFYKIKEIFEGYSENCHQQNFFRFSSIQDNKAQDNVNDKNRALKKKFTVVTVMIHLLKVISAFRGVN